MSALAACEIPDMSRFALSPETGFLPPEFTGTLPSVLIPFQTLAARLHEVKKDGTLRIRCREFPVLDVEEFEPVVQEQAFSIFCYIAHAYLWADGEHKMAPESLPPAIATPLWLIARMLGRKPVFCNAAAMNIWQVIDRSKPLIPENIKLRYNMTGNIGEDWFFTVPMACDVVGASAIKGMISHKHEDVAEGLRSIATALAEIKAIFRRLPASNFLSLLSERLEPEYFFHTLRPYMFGSANNPMMPNGLIYEGISAQYQKFPGASASQMPLFPSLDAALGIMQYGFAKDMSKNEVDFFQLMRGCMPRPHREFIEWLLAHPCIRDYVLAEGGNHGDLYNAYNAAILAFVDFRSQHVRNLALYVVIPGARAKSKFAKVGSSGTGGSSVMSLLKRMRDITKTCTIDSS